MINLDDIRDALITKSKYWVVFTGDSITSCEWVHPNWREIVEYVLKEEVTKVLNQDWQIPSWGIRTFNFAYDGATTKDILEKTSEILIVTPDLVISVMGGNDPAFDLTINDHVSNIRKIKSRVTAFGSKLVWCTSTSAGEGSKKNLEYAPFAKACMQIPEDENFQLVDLFNIYQKFPTKRFFTFISEENEIEGIKEGDSDLQHPNPLGNAYIAKVILSQVFNIEFDPEKYIRNTAKGKKYPEY